MRRIRYELAKRLNRLRKNGKWTQATIGDVQRVSFPDRDIDLRAGTSDFSTFIEIFDCKAYDLSQFPQWPAILRHYAESTDPLIVDAGANVGMAALWFAETYPKARILAIEPEPGNFRELQRHAASYPQIRPIQAALAREDGFARVTDPGLGDWGFRTEKADSGVPSISLPTLLDGDPFLLKVDIEGGEMDLFEPESFDRFPVVIAEIHDWIIPGSSRSFVKTIGALDRDLLISGENLISIKRSIDLY